MNLCLVEPEAPPLENPDIEAFEAFLAWKRLKPVIAENRRMSVVTLEKPPSILLKVGKNRLLLGRSRDPLCQGHLVQSTSFWVFGSSYIAGLQHSR